MESGYVEKNYKYLQSCRLSSLMIVLKYAYINAQLNRLNLGPVLNMANTYCTFFFIKVNFGDFFVLSGLQVLLPDYLQERFVQAALSYIACNSEGEFICKDNDCWCHCGPKFPECNCPSMDIQAMEENLLRITETWKAYNSDFEESGKRYILI